MNKFISKKLIALATLVVCIALTSNVFALPGFTPHIPDRSGEYVFYRDYSFPRESYVGFLAYDNSTYAARYFAPRDVAKNLVEENVLIYFTLDPDSDYISMTGERIGNAITPEQTDIVNYLHDLVYEFNARRIRADNVNPKTANIFGKKYLDSGLSVSQDYAQFGGKVHIIFDYLVPLFNIKKILSNDNTVILEVATIGTLQSSDDASFISFAGISDATKSSASTKKYSAWTPDKSAKKNKCTVNGQQVTLDSSWTNSMENLWLLGDEALLSMSSANLTPEQLLRMSMQNANWKNLAISKNGKSYTLSSTYYQPASGNIMKGFRIITEMSDGTCAVFMLTIFNNTYEANKKYFDEIVKSYKGK